MNLQSKTVRILVLLVVMAVTGTLAYALSNARKGYEPRQPILFRHTTQSVDVFISGLRWQSRHHCMLKGCWTETISISSILPWQFWQTTIGLPCSSVSGSRSLPSASFAFTCAAWS